MIKINYISFKEFLHEMKEKNITSRNRDSVGAWMVTFCDTHAKFETPIYLQGNNILLKKRLFGKTWKQIVKEKCFQNYELNGNHFYHKAEEGKKDGSF